MMVTAFIAAHKSTVMWLGLNGLAALASLVS